VEDMKKAEGVVKKQTGRARALFSVVRLRFVFPSLCPIGVTKVGRFR
jgi:hypothetical protein